MTTTISTPTLKRALKHVKRIVPTTKAAQSAGAHLTVLTLTPEGLRISGTNSDLHFETTLEAHSDNNETTRVAVNPRTLDKIMSIIPGNNLTLTPTNDGLALESENYRTTVDTRPPDDAPQLSMPKGLPGVWNVTDFLQAITTLQPAAATAEYQGVYRSLKLELDGHTRIVATDGFRMAYMHYEHTTGLDGTANIPAKAAKTLGRILKQIEKRTDNDELRLGYNEQGDTLAIGVGDWTFGIKLIDGAWPDYERVIPANCPVVIQIDATKLRDVIDRVAIMTDKKTNNRLDLEIDNGLLTVTADTYQSSATEYMAVTHHKGENAETQDELTVAMNAKYLQDALAPITGDAILKFSGFTSSCLILDSKDTAYVSLVVPLRTN